MLDRLGPYILTNPVGGAAGIESRDATAGAARADMGRVRLDAAWVGDAPSGPAMERFHQEAEAASGLEHEGVVRLLDHGLDAGFAYVVYAAREHRTLADLLAETDRGHLEPEVAALLVADVAGGLAEAHALWPPLAHRGVQPRTIRVGTDGRARLHGYALVTLAQTLARARGAPSSDTAYLSPEVVQDGQVTERTDLFSLGSTLYEALSGRATFAGPNPLATSIRLRAGTYASLDEVAPGLPAELRALVGELLVVDPSKRPTAAAVRDALAALTGDEASHRERLAQRVRPSAPLPRVANVKTDREMPAFSIDVRPPSDLPAAVTSAIPAPPPAGDESFPQTNPSVALPFADLDGPTAMNRLPPEIPLATGPHEEPTLRETDRFAEALAREAPTPVRPTSSAPPSHRPGPAGAVSSAPSHPAPAPDQAPRARPSLARRLGLVEDGFPVGLVVAFGVAAAVLVGLTAALAAWVAS